ncbi:hypothetical protein DFH07DRAFT_513958 [Mycena maculata]|uniref:F-box domain-containing protein n=1 Tax=Mycena maculata TaxID=230809 RepID=A0AAD7IYV0_9AGAR|nr:hypothetical protein DFH07DRAFT_513958 [Mycena maculata]
MGFCTRCGQIDQNRELSSSFERLALQPKINPTQAARDRLETLVSEITILSAHLKDLWAERDVVQAQLDAVAYPVLTLPPEVTTDIFLHCLPKSPHEPRPRLAPLLLGGICRDWRAIALATPRFWSVLRVKLDRYPTRPHVLAELLRTWLSRSGSQPLNLGLCYEDPPSAPSPEAVIHTLLLHAHHWEDVELVLPHADMLRIFEDFFGRFPLLKKLELCQSEFGVRDPPCSFRNLRHSYELRQFVVDGDTLHPLPNELPWARLTRFHGFAVTVMQGFEVLRLAQSLEECTLDLKPSSLDVFPSPTQNTEMTLINLRSLKLFKMGMMFDGLGLLALLTLPALQELHLAVDHNNIEDFLPFVSRSACTLSRLRASFSLDETHFVRCLAALPNFLDLNLKFDLQSLPLRLATILNRRNGYLPRLISLRIIAQGTEQNMGYQPLLDMLESRRDGTESTARLQVFDLRFLAREIGPPEPVIVRRLQALEKQGMCISVKLASGVQVP